MNSHRTIICLLTSLVLLPACATPVPPEPERPESVPDSPRNIILMIGDGMGLAQVKSYRYYADDLLSDGIDPLPFDQYLRAVMATDAINQDVGGYGDHPDQLDPYGITDSASSASAYSTGEDTLVGSMGMTMDGRRQEYISEKAKKAGLSVGLVSTSQVTHATPAAFYAHVESRSETSAIANQLFDNQWNGAPVIDVILGGGTAYLEDAERNLVSEFADAGYTIVRDREELKQVSDGRILGLFAPIGLPMAWDRPDDVPSLAEMTQTAIQSLETNPQGFFLMIEGSQIDWAAHSNDIVGVISEMEDFTRAISVALAYAANHDDTLVVITADHETGGLSLGRDDVYRWNPRAIRGMDRTPAGITEEFLSGDEPLSAVAQRHLPFELDDSEREKLDTASREEPPEPTYGVAGTQAYALLCEVLDLRTLTGWSTTGHTGVDVPIYVHGPGSGQFQGVIQNEEFGRKLQALLLGE